MTSSPSTSEAPSLREILLWPVVFLSGCLLVVSLFVLMTALLFPPDNQVDCGGKRMSGPGEVCIGGGTYSQMIEREHEGHQRRLIFGAAGFVAGGLLTGGGIFVMRAGTAKEFGSDPLRGVWLEEKGRFDAAEQWHREAIKNGRADSMIDLGRLLERRGDLDAAESAYRNASQSGVEGADTNLARLKADRRNE